VQWTCDLMRGTRFVYTDYASHPHFNINQTSDATTSLKCVSVNFSDRLYCTSFMHLSLPLNNLCQQLRFTLRNVFHRSRSEISCLQIIDIRAHADTSKLLQTIKQDLHPSAETSEILLRVNTHDLQSHSANSGRGVS
jgi:hypothetical protein